MRDKIEAAGWSAVLLITGAAIVARWRMAAH